MNSLHLDPQKNHEIFQKIIDIGRISAKGHIGTHLDCYTYVPEKSEYSLSAYVADCTKGMPDAEFFENLPDMQNKVLVLHTGNTEKNGYGTDNYFKAKTFLSPASLKTILAKAPLFIIIDSHGLGESGKVHVTIDKTCEQSHCHVIENADLSPLKGQKEIKVRIVTDTDMPSTGKPCKVYWENME